MRCSNCGTELRPEARFCTTCGTPVAQPAAQPTAPPPAPVHTAPSQPVASFGDAPRAQLSGVGQPRKKSGCAKALVVLLILGVLVLGGLGVAGYFGYRFAEGKLKSSEPYALALRALRENPEAAEKLGDVKETGFPVGAFNESADGTGTAAFHMSVTGTKATGQYDVQLNRRGGKWYLNAGALKLSGGETIVVRNPLGNLPSGDGPNANGAAPPPPPPPGKAGKGTVVSGGVLEGKAVSKPQPAYPQVAKAVKATGAVVVQVTVDEQGQVTEARAVSGHPLLRAAAESAARQARFTPTLLSGKPVKVSGTLTYNFVLE
jgi:TonB family protein